MAHIIEDMATWMNDTFGTTIEVSSFIGGPEYYMALGIAGAFFLFIGLLLAGALGNRPRLSILCGGAVVALCLGFLVQHHVDLIDWLSLGFQFTDAAASIFSLGLTAFVCVLGWNMIRTKGDKLVL